MRRLLLRAMSFAGSQLRHTRLAQSALLNRIFASLALKAYASNEANVASLRVHFDRRDQVIAKRLVLYGGHERAEIELLCSLARPGDQMLDVGANIGLYTLHLSRAVGPKGCVVAVEPDPDNLALLRKNLKINSCLNVIVIPAAFGAKPARM